MAGKKELSAEELIQKMRQNKNRMNTKGSEAARKAREEEQRKRDQKSSTVGSE